MCKTSIQYQAVWKIDHKLQQPPAFQGRPYWHCEATGDVLINQSLLGRSWTPNRIEKQQILQRWRIPGPSGYKGALWFRKIIYCWCFTNWGTGSFRNIIYKVSKNIQKVVVCDIFFINRIDHSDEMSVGFQHLGTRSGRFCVLSIYWDQKIVWPKVHLVHGPKFNDFQVPC